MSITTSRLESFLTVNRINEFNVEDTLTLFLPYHESPHFAKMVTLLHIKSVLSSFKHSVQCLLLNRPNSTWSFLNAYRSAAQSVPRQSLVTEMLRNVDLTRFIVSLLPSAIQGGYVHRALIAFHTGVFIDYVARDKTIDDGVLAFLLPSLLAPLPVALSIYLHSSLCSYTLKQRKSLSAFHLSCLAFANPELAKCV